MVKPKRDSRDIFEKALDPPPGYNEGRIIGGAAVPAIAGAIIGGRGRRLRWAGAGGALGGAVTALQIAGEKRALKQSRDEFRKRRRKK